MPLQSATSIGNIRRAARAALRPVTDTAAIDTDLLLAAVLSIPRGSLDTLDAIEVNMPQQSAFEQLLARRMAGEPVAYITGSKAFWTLEVQVSTATLVPRPETELVVERALHHVQRRQHPQIADLGTGSGCIALALADELDDAVIVATDRCADALAVAEQNCQTLGFSNVTFRQGDWTQALPAWQFDIIVANPPYIADFDPCLDDRLMGFEPKSALLGGSDGLDAIRRIVTTAQRYLKTGGWLIIEHGYEQGEVVRTLFQNSLFTNCSTAEDLAGLERVTEGQLWPNSKGCA